MPQNRRPGVSEGLQGGEAESALVLRPMGTRSRTFRSWANRSSISKSVGAGQLLRWCDPGSQDVTDTEWELAMDCEMIFRIYARAILSEVTYGVLFFNWPRSGWSVVRCRGHGSSGLEAPAGRSRGRIDLSGGVGAPTNSAISAARFPGRDGSVDA
jgi:hypothetical protein